MTSRTPLPFELALDSGLVLRGLEYPQDGPPVLLVHDLGGDADSWAAMPRTLMEKGFRAIVLELRGHGLSDGEPDDDATGDDIAEAARIIKDLFGPAALVSYGSVATALLNIGEETAPVHILISPLPRTGFDPARSQPAMRAIFSGTMDEEADALIRTTYQSLAGQNMWFSTGSSDRGVELLLTHPSMIEQVVMFIRRYLVGHHLAWIAEHQPDGNEPEDADETEGADG